ncbi:MAG: hypothetical protein FJW56_04310, partial [Actinobacteria bacterium]|nr:hypothetical protein [Actinomycetota bacterium]
MAKICPILNIGRTDKTLKCIGDECMFYDFPYEEAEEKICSFTALAYITSGVCDDLNNIFEE